MTLLLELAGTRCTFNLNQSHNPYSGLICSGRSDLNRPLSIPAMQSF
jgi:hypothetical protein